MQATQDIIENEIRKENQMLKDTSRKKVHEKKKRLYWVVIKKLIIDTDQDDKRHRGSSDIL